MPHEDLPVDGDGDDHSRRAALVQLGPHQRVRRVHRPLEPLLLLLLGALLVGLLGRGGGGGGGGGGRRGGAGGGHAGGDLQEGVVRVTRRWDIGFFLLSTRSVTST